MSSPRTYRGIRVDNGEWVKGFLAAPDQIMTWDEELGVGSMIQVHPESVGQYTGLKDKNRTEEFPEGQPIYEGDVVDADANSQGLPGVVVWAEKYNGWALKIISGHYKGHVISFSGELVVVTHNIHTTPELLEDK
ncbi:hypothetical protein LCGC14_1764820 [marine sediment metagenome]|uniref:YopX protein domain-containing protein n=1 Tax=marine sediment metagenome TaxID=412755 RepID=A0A0F9JEY8_9ZZZZ